MIPIKDHNPPSRPTPVSKILLGINIIIFLFMFTLSDRGLNQFIDHYALIPREISHGLDLYTLITSMFLHGGLGHIISNMLFLNIFADNVEDKLGSIKFLFFYLVCGLGGSLLQILVSPRSTIPNLGASGAIAGLMGSYLVFFPQHKIDVLFSYGYVGRRATVPAYTMLFYWFIAQTFSGLGSLGYQDMGGVAFFAHIGGFATGWVISKLVKIKK